MRNLYSIAILLAAILVVIVSQRAHSQSVVPRLRVAHFMEKAPTESVDFYVDDGATPFATGLRFAEASASVPITVGDHRVVAVASGASKSEAIFTEEFTVTSDSAYTVYAVRTPGDTLRGITFGRTLTPVYKEFNNLIIGVVHASPKLGEIRLMGRDPNGKNVFAVQLWFARQGIEGGLLYYPQQETRITSTLLIDNQPTNIYFTGQYIGPQVLTMVISGTIAENTLGLYMVRDSDTLEQRPVEKQRYANQGDGGMRYVDCVPDEFTGEASGRRFIRSLIAYWNQSAQFLGATGVIDDLLGPTIAQTYVGLDGPPEQFQILYDTVNVQTDTLYTLFVVGTGMDSNASTVILPTNWNDRPASGKVRLRLLQTIPDLGSVDLQMKFSDGEERTVAGLEFKEHSEYIEVAGGPVTVRCLQAGGGKVLFESRGGLPSDSTYTLLLTGMESRKTMGATLLNDSYSELQKPMVQFTTVTTDAGESVAGIGGMAVWPNPVRDQLGVRYKSGGVGTERIEVIDLFGRLVLRQVVEGGIAGERLVGVSVMELSSGSYRVRVIDGGGRELGSGSVLVVK